MLQTLGTQATSAVTDKFRERVLRPASTAYVYLLLSRRARRTPNLELQREVVQASSSARDTVAVVWPCVG